jgi:hypothetical protein
MPPGFSLNTDLIIGVNAPLVGKISLSLLRSRTKIRTLFHDGWMDGWMEGMFVDLRSPPNTLGNFWNAFKKEDKHFYC